MVALRQGRGGHRVLPDWRNRFGLYPRDELAKDAGVAPGVTGFGGITLAYNARTRDEADAVLAEAVAAGATL